MIKQICAAALTLALVFPVGIVFADSAQPEQKPPRLCKEEVKKFCSGVAHGGGRIIKCLKEHEHDLNEGCKAALDHVMKQRSKEQKTTAPSSAK